MRYLDKSFSVGMCSEKFNEGWERIYGDKMKRKLYLAGPMTGLTLEESAEWRIAAADRLEPLYECFSPLRGKSYLKGQTHKSDGPERAGGDKGIFRRDRWDVRTSDVVLANFVGSTSISIGTLFEIAWANALEKFVIVVMEPTNLHQHAFVRQAASIVVSNMDEAVAFLEMLAQSGGGA